jgi:hypothetical protein
MQAMTVAESKPLGNCPLCGNLATFEPSGDGRFRRFLCAVCTDFVISAGAQEMVAGSAPAARKDLSHAAQGSLEGEVLVICRHASDSDRLQLRRMKL